MPSYDFKCEKCELIFEKNYKMNDTKTPSCPVCDSSKTNRLYSPTSMIMGESKATIPKEVDIAIGASAEKRWLDYEARKNEKLKVKKEFGTEKLARDMEGNYTPLSVMKDGVQVPENESIALRKQMAKEFNTVISDPETKKFKPNE